MKKIFSTNKLFSGVILFAALGFTQSAKAQEVITIQQAVDNALNNNLTIKQAKFNASLSEENLLQSKYALYPSVNGSVSQQVQWGRSQLSTGLFQNTQTYTLVPNLNANLDLFGGSAKINQIKQNKILLSSDQTNVDKVKNDLILNVVTAYLQILNNEDQVKATQQQLEVAQATIKRESALLDVGNKTLADISQAKSQVATAELNLTNAKNLLTISYLTLGQFMEMRPPFNFKVQAPLINEINNIKNSYEPNEIYLEALKIFPDIKLANLNSKAAEIGVKIAKGGYFPKIGLNGGIGSFYQYQFNASIFPNTSFRNQISTNFGQSIGMGINIPIFNGFTTRTSVRRAKIILNQRLTDEQLAKNNLNKVINQAVADLVAAESRYASTQNAFNAQKDAFYVVEQRYNVGLVNSLDYSTAQTNRNKAEIDFIQAKYDLIFRAKVIDYYLGKQITF